MLENLEKPTNPTRDEYEGRLPSLRTSLLNTQFDLRQAPFPVLILLAGNDFIGCNAMVNLLHEWMDARYVKTRVFGRPTEEERERPRFWRYWNVLPANGQIGLYVGAWPQAAIADRGLGRISRASFEQRLDHIARFENTLVDQGALVLKFWLQIPKKELRKRVERAQKDPDRNWRVGENEFTIYENWSRFLPLAERLLKHSQDGLAPWQVIHSSRERHRNLEVAETIQARIQQRLESPATSPPPNPPAAAAAEPASCAPDGALGQVDLSSSLHREKYQRALAKQQRKLRKLSLLARTKRVSSVLVFEGWDAAGKGGAIRRITGALEAADYRIVPIAAPSEEELSHHYLWRFWRHLPRAGHMLIFDRSWYGRVLVERVEGFASQEAWTKAYDEIRDFEGQLTDHGIPVVKFWLHIDPDTQLERFQERERTPYKKYKITDDDYRNRGRWNEYCLAIEEMVERTSTERAPWHIIPANDKRFARIEVLKQVCAALGRVT